MQEQEKEHNLWYGHPAIVVVGVIDGSSEATSRTLMSLVLAYSEKARQRNAIVILLYFIVLSPLAKSNCFQIQNFYILALLTGYPEEARQQNLLMIRWLVGGRPLLPRSAVRQPPSNRRGAVESQRHSRTPLPPLLCKLYSNFGGRWRNWFKVSAETTPKQKRRNRHIVTLNEEGDS
ncbi:hypothetical protein M9H77_27275 [Catharanthus roseus]|uniref:Uncharacterized protein n=1 Tax=Catharanthus roseus TaxID=4058 RepID=A0ACC0AC11_CATRO|nr:hypothetical protein M9H77_27275 [Catharanthus roseus]